MAEGRKRFKARAGGQQPVTLWQRFLESSGGAALITAFATLLLFHFNAGVKPAPPAPAPDKPMRDAYGPYIIEQREFVFGTVGLIGRCLSAADGLIALTDPVFDPSRYEGGLKGQRDEMRNGFNECAKEWNDREDELKFKMNYYHGAQPGVVEAWGGVQKATTEVMDCAQRWYVTHDAAPVETRGVCQAEKDEATRRMEEFGRQVGASLQHAWQEWQSAARADEAGKDAKQRRVEPVR